MALDTNHSFFISINIKFAIFLIMEKRYLISVDELELFYSKK